MNQILYTGKSKGGKLSMDTSIKIFAVAIIVFGLILTVNGSYAVYKDVTTKPQVVEEWPQVSMEQTENTLKVIVKNNNPIDKIVYNWNGENERIILGQGKTEIEKDIEIPVGTNVFNMTVSDTLGLSKQYTNVYTASEVIDTTKPVIELVLSGSRLSISAKSMTDAQLSYLTYRWNNEPETRIDATVGDLKTIETKIDILKGTNTLTVVAVDKNNNTQTQVKEFKGVTKPVITVERSGTNLMIKMTHETGVKSADIVFNDKNIVLTDSWFGKKEVSLSLQLKQGTNNLTITAYSLDDTNATYKGTTEY